MIDSKEAMEALGDISDITKRVRQSQIYQLTSLILIMWGTLIVIGNLATWAWPRYGGYIWLGVDGAATVGLFVVSAYHHARSKVRTFDARALLALLFIMVFGFFCCYFGHFTPRQQTAFWPVYIMLFHMMAGLWFGHVFLIMGATITALTLAGYYLIPGFAFLLWMAVVNGGGLIAGGLWMRRS